MKSTKRLVALILAMLMIISCVPLGIFAAEETATASTLVYESPIYEDETISGYKQYEAMWTDSTYVKGDVKYTVYFDTENATKTRDVVFYVINWNGERIGTDSDVDIVKDLILAPASVESGNRWAVVVVDFGGNPLAKSPYIETSLAFLRAELPGKLKLTVWADETHETTKTVTVHEDHVYVLPAGYRVARDIPYFETDYHASLGTRDYVVSGWNSHVAWNDSLVESVYKAKVRNPKAVEYAWHTGNTATCTYDHATYTDVECYAGAPQEIDGVVVPYKNIITHTGDKSTCKYPHTELTSTECKKGTTANINWAPVVTRYEDLRKRDGSPLDYVCRLDIIYPSGENVEATPVMVQAATQSPRMRNVGTVGSKDYDGDGVESLKNRTMLVGMEFSGYTVAVYDYAYSPMSRGDHYGYIDPYGAHGSNAAKTSRAAIRCIRYFAEQYGYNDSLIGAAGISKGTPTTAVLSTVNNKYVDEASTFKYDIDGSGTKVETRDLWYEGDIGADGLVPEGITETKIIQPYLTYEAGYNGKHIDGDDVNYSVTTRTGEISSDVSVVYCAAGDGINRIYSGGQSIILGGTNPHTGEETQHVPMVLSCGYYDEYGCWNHWPSIQARFTEYADYPFLAIGMEDMGHDYPSGIDPMRDYDRYNAYMQFFHSILKPELYTPQVAWMMPVDGAKNVSVVENIQVQLIKPATTLDAFVAATTVKDSYGNSVDGTWTTNTENTSGLYTFTPDDAYLGGTEYTVTVGTPVVATATSKSFTAEAAGFLRPIADTYVSEIYKDGVFGTEKTLYIDNQRTYLATFNTADFEDANRAKLALPLTGTGSQTLSVYVLDGFKVDESKTCYNNMPELTDSKLVGTYDISEGDSTVDLLDIVSRVSSEQFTIAIKGSAHYYKLDFEEFSAGTVIVDYNTGTKPQPADAPGADDCYSPNYIWRSGGATGEMKAVNDPDGSDNIVASVVSDQTHNRIRWYNTFVRDKAYLDSTDIGKTFNLSFDLRIKVPDSSAPKMGYALDATNGKLASHTAKPTADTWTNVTKSFVIDEDIISTNGTATKKGVLSFTLNGAIGSTYYFDDIIVSEAAPTTLISREDTSAMTAYISTSSVSEDGVVADTYVSATQPDTALGKSEKLLLNGGDDENIIFLTYPSKLIEGRTDLQFTVPAEDDASVKAEVLLLDGYFVDEERLTYNNMPDLSKAVSLGEYTLKGGVNIIEAENAVSKIKGNYFTVVFKATDSIETVYFKNFEDYAVGDNVDATSYNVTDSTTTNADGKNYTYYYAHLAEGTDSKRYLARSGGAAAIADPLGNVLVDPSDDNNQIINLKLGTGKYNGRIKFYNSISDSVMTETDPLIGQTLRFTAKVKAGSQTTVNNACTVYACPMLSAGSAALTDANQKPIKSQDIIVNNEWQTVTVDYTVAAKDIKVDTTASGNPAWGYPAFTLEFNNTNLSNTYLIDDLTVVKLNSDGTVSRLDMASSEGAEHAGETIGLRARKSKDPVADTYISAANKDGVFGFEKTLYADSQRTYLATFKTSDFNITDKGYLLLPLSGSGRQTLSVYLIDGFVVDENATCYNNTPELTDDKLIDTVEALEGEKKINLNTILSGVTDDYFTIAIKGTAHCFEENFDNFTVDKSLKVFNANNTYSDSDYEALKNGACSTENFVWRTGGATPTLYAKADPADSTNKVAYVQSNYTYNRIKWYNSFVKGDKLYFGQEDLGKTFNVSYKVRVNIPNGVVVDKLSITHEMSKGVSNDYYGHKATPLEANTWTTINTSFTVNQSMIDNKSGMFGFMLSSTVLTIDGNTPTNASSNKVKYYFDDIVVSEEAAGEIASLDALIEKTPYVISTKDIVADTYVSKGNPDTCYGDEEVLKLGDKGGDKKALVLSFMNSALDARNYVELNLNNGGDALKDVSVYYVLDYCADESTLTWNKMPEYEDNLLGKFDIGEGSTQIDLSALQGKLTGEYFTLVLRTENHTFLENFELCDVGTTIYDGTNSGDNNVADTTNTSMLHYHAFYENVYNASAKKYITRRNGLLDTRKVIGDDSNKYATVSTSLSQNYDGSMKFYNSLNYGPITKTSDIVGKTLRFSVKVKFDPDNSNMDKTSVADVTAGVMTSYSNAYRSDTVVAKYDDMKDDWATLTFDYTVSADHIMESITSSGKTHYSYPIFGLYFGDDNLPAKDTTTPKGYHTYFIDDISVVEVVDGEAVGDAIFGSREAYSKDVRFVSALNGNVTILETNVSSSTTGDVFSFIDGMETHSLLTVKNGNLVFGDTVLCDEDGNDYVLGDKNIKVVAIYDDTKGTVRFAIGDYLAYYKDAEGEIHATYEHLVIDGGISENTSLGTANATLTKLNRLTSEIIGSQTHALENSVRIVSGVDTIYYNEIGFMLESDGDGEKKIGSPIVYSSVVADDKDVFAKDYGYNFMSALAIKEVKNGGVIKVTPFLRVGTNYIYGETVFYKITTSGGISVTEVDESEFTAPTNANLASVTVDGEPLVGLSTDKLNYTVGVADPLSIDIVAVAEEPEATVEIAKNENTATITVTAYDGLTKKVYTVTAYEKVESSVVNKNGANAIVTYTFDDGNTDSASIVVGLADKYPSLTGSFALITNKLATLSTIEGDPDDGLLEYEFDENGDYVYTKDEEVWAYWENLFDNYGDRGFEGVSHTHTHKYIGENDNGGSFVYKNTAGESFTSAVFPIGNVRKEYYASNQILRELGQRALVMVGAGLTANGYMVDYTENYKNLPKTSGAFIGKRKTVNSPANPADMVNLASEFLSDDCRFNVKAYMVQHYATSATAPKNTSATDYSKEACMAAGVGYWTDYIDKAVEMGEWAAFCFHNVKPDTYTETGGHFVFESQADAVFSYTENLSKENKVWVANFTDACLYMFERSTAEVNAHIADNGNIVVSLDDKEDDEIFTMPLTVKVALPEGKTGAKLGETELVAFTENETVYVYVDIVPGNSATLTVE